VGVGGFPPVLDEGRPGAGRGVGDCDAAVRDVAVDRLPGLTFAEQGQRVAFPFVGLPAVGGQLVGAEPFGQAPRKAPPASISGS
jgi:hypothetical protein